MSKIADRKLDQHVCEEGKGRLPVEKWSSYAAGGTFGNPTEVDWWIIEGSEPGGRRIVFCPYCKIELDDSSGTAPGRPLGER